MLLPVLACKKKAALSLISAIYSSVAVPSSGSGYGRPRVYVTFVTYVTYTNFAETLKSLYLRGFRGFFRVFLSAQRLPGIRPFIAPYPPKDCPINALSLPPLAFLYVDLYAGFLSALRGFGIAFNKAAAFPVVQHLRYIVAYIALFFLCRLAVAYLAIKRFI